MGQILILPSVEYLRDIITYEPAMGELRWRIAKGKNAPAGQIINSGIVKIDGVNYKPARVAWKIMTGEEPPEHIDHRDRDHSNNAWCNLREATATQQTGNRRNQRDLFPRGVYKKQNGWSAYSFDKAKKTRLGFFHTEQEAIDAVQRTRFLKYGEFAAE